MTPPSIETCPYCGAKYLSNEAFCWMCHHRLWGPDDRRQSLPAQSPPPKPELPVQTPVAAKKSESDLTKEEPILITAIIVILLGSLVLPRLNIFALILFFPFVLIFASKGRQTWGEPNSPAEKIGKAFEILMKAIAILIFGAMALSIALFAVCLFAIATAGHR